MGGSGTNLDRGAVLLEMLRRALRKPSWGEQEFVFATKLLKLLEPDNSTTAHEIVATIKRRIEVELRRN